MVNLGAAVVLSLRLGIALGAGVSLIRFGHFIGRSDNAPSINIIFPDVEPVVVKALNLTNYISFNTYSPKLSVKIQGGSTFTYTVPTNASAYRGTVYFTWNGGPISNWVEDLIDPKQIFSSLSKRYPVSRPYHNNTLVRFIAIDPQSRNLTFSVKGLLPDETGYLMLSPSGFGDYLLDSSYSQKMFRVEAANESTPVSKKFEAQESLGLHGVYTVFWYGDSISESKYVLVEDHAPPNGVLPLVFFAVYVLAWLTFRRLYQVLETQRAKNNFYIPKTIRVQSPTEKEELLTAEDIPYIDTFRGLAIMLFIFVKSGGGNYWYLNETLWNGLSIGDLPKFLISWIMGFCVPLHIAKMKYKSKTDAMKMFFLKSFIVCTLGNAD